MAQDAAGTVGARVSPQVDSLIRAAQAGDQDAFEQLVRTYDQSVLRLAMNLLRSPEDARDVYQEAFLRVYRNLHAFRFDCSFHTWLYRIVTNICLDQLRRRKEQSNRNACSVLLPYLVVPDCDEYLFGSVAQKEGPQGGVPDHRNQRGAHRPDGLLRSEEHTSELQSLT